jgi:hypothetical protein
MLHRVLTMIVQTFLLLTGAGNMFMSSPDYTPILATGMMVSGAGIILAVFEKILPLKILFMVLHGIVLLDATSRMSGFGNIFGWFR